MTPATHTIHQGDSQAVMETLPPESVQLVMTSPPYFGLRDYRGAEGSLAGQWGREATPEEHVARLVEWGREVRRVLRKDGVLIINYGYLYVDKQLLDMPGDIARAFKADGWWLRQKWDWVKMNGMPESCRDRPALSCEVMLMFTRSARYYWDQEAVRVGYAPATVERADGSQVTTGNPDVRPGFKRTLSRAAVFSRQTKEQVIPGQQATQHREDREPVEYAGHGRIRKTGDWHRESVALAAATAGLWADHAEHWLEHGGMLLDLDGLPLGQLHPTYAYPGSHFATYPPALVRPIIRAATSERGGCPVCGAPWVREVAVRAEYENATNGTRYKNRPGGKGSAEKQSGTNPATLPPKHSTTGWRPSCGCVGDDGKPGEPVPQVVLDPFCGTGTTNVVAAEEGRSSIGIDLYGGNHDFGGHTANDRLRAAAGTGPALDVVQAEREGQMSLLGEHA